ncbi:MAG: rRNA cytosine-C5-methyltransferase, partial [Muribaculaceae bacterium]|nr:rRNA cytosine-C5-methyltransferase [Muribaculaceae bacterium]
MPLPKQFIEQITALTALEPRVGGLIEALESTPASVSVRLNMRGSHKPVTDIAGRPLGNPVPWCDNGYYLAERPRFTLDPAIHQGRYYVQDASSMFLSHVIDTLTRDERDTPLVYLDACAAPGGKTTAAIDRLPAGSLVVANEWDFKRASILRENLSKWGHPDTVVSRGDTRRIAKLRAMFDIIAADVPCSGEGMMRKDPEAVSQWSPALVAQCAER